MTESDSFSSLSALISSHLSKCSIQASGSDNHEMRGSNLLYTEGGSCGLPPTNAASDTRTGDDTDQLWSSQPKLAHGGAMSETSILRPSQQFIIPTLSNGGPVRNVLAEQIANTLKAQVLKGELQRRSAAQAKAEEQVRNSSESDEEDCDIDLMKALMIPYSGSSPAVHTEESQPDECPAGLFEPHFTNCEMELEPMKTPEPLLSCNWDIFQMLPSDINTAKCSSVGRVLSKRYQEVTMPYNKARVKNNIVRFDFKEKSQDDIVKSNLNKPFTYNTYAPSFAFP